MYLVLVTYGTRQDQVFAKTTALDGAKRLKALAVSLKYTDARIREVTEAERVEIEHPRRKGKPDGKSDRKVDGKNR